MRFGRIAVTFLRVKKAPYFVLCGGTTTTLISAGLVGKEVFQKGSILECASCMPGKVAVMVPKAFCSCPASACAKAELSICHTKIAVPESVKFRGSEPRVDEAWFVDCEEKSEPSTSESGVPSEFSPTSCAIA